MANPSAVARLRSTAIALAVAAAFLLTLALCLRGGWFSHYVPAPGEPPVTSAEELRGTALGVVNSLAQITSLSPLPICLVLASAGLGYPLRRWLAPRTSPAFLVQPALGAAVILASAWTLGHLALLRTLSAWALLVIGLGLLLLQFWRSRLQSHWHPDYWPAPPFTCLLATPALAALLVAALCPPGTLWAVEALGYDAMSYHLALPKTWLTDGVIRPLNHDVYSYLPNLVEAGYTFLGALHGSQYDAIVLCQLAHAGLAVLTATILGALAASRVGPQPAWLPGAVGGLAASLLLLAPWTVITGSLAYNEAAALLLAALALHIALGPDALHPRAALLIGFLLGLAALAKLTAGPMLAAPIALIYLARATPGPASSGWGDNPASEPPSPAPAVRRALALLALVLLAGVLTLFPYLLRNSLHTGNPVFPFASELFGRGHWTPELVERWQRGHSELNAPPPIAALWRQWLGNTGFGSYLGDPVRHDPHNIARFPTEGGIPFLLLPAVIALAWLVRRRSTRMLGLALAGTLCFQLAFWLIGTHRQSRFLLPTLLPLALATPLALSHLVRLRERRGVWVWVLPALPLMLLLPDLLGQQTVARIPPYRLVGMLATPAELRAAQAADGLFGDHPINHLPPDARVLMVADTARLLFIRRPVVYSSAFDESPLGRILRDTRPTGSPEGALDPTAVNDALRQLGVTHVWLHWAELDRLRSTYGHDPDLTPDRLRALIAAGWRAVYSAPGQVTLYALPRSLARRP